MIRLGAVTLALWLAAAASAQYTAPPPVAPPGTLPPAAPNWQSPPPFPTGGKPPALPAAPNMAAPAVPAVGSLMVAPMNETPVTVHGLRVPSAFSAAYNSSYSAPYYAPVNRPNMNPDRGPRGCTTCCEPDAICGPCGSIWGDVEYIFWRARADSLPPLVTTSPAGTSAAQAGVIGAPGTRVVVGGPFGDDWRSGIRGSLGVWLNSSQTIGIQVGAFVLNDVESSIVAASNGDPVLARPFTNAITGAQGSQLVAIPGLLAGSVGVDHSSGVNGFDAALRGNLCCGRCYRIDALLGYRYLRLDDDLGIREDLTAGPTAPSQLGVPVGTNITVHDRFTTSNTFNGVQLGVAGEVRFLTMLFVSGSAKASLGWMDHGSDIYGDTVVNIPGQASVRNLGGLYALSSNIGRHERTDAVIIPEVNLNLGVQVNRFLRLKAGYNFLYCSSVTRPGTILDTSVNPALVPPASGTTPVRPAYISDTTEYFLHGLNAGVELRF